MFSSNVSLLLIEACVYLLIAAAAVVLPRTLFAWLKPAGQWYVRLAVNRKLSILLVVIIVLALRGGLTPLLPTPVPGVHDEFSYLLAGETFASGRLTNPPHPLWKSFETFYVIQQPTYASMYPPGQGFALALGDLFGHPWLGVLFLVAVMCGAICWMLQAWVPPHWALTGALIVALRIGVYSYWIESYWGGAVAALGGALAAGAVPRILRRPSVWHSVVLGLGLIILANSRPFEGLLFGVAMLSFLIVSMLRNKTPTLSVAWTRIALPLLAMLLIGATAMGYYFWRVTGNPRRMPYQLHELTYQVTDPFVWQPIRKAPGYRYVVMEKYHVERETAAYRQAHSLRGWLAEAWRKAESVTFFYFWPAVLPTILVLPRLWRNRKARFALLAGLLMLMGLTLEIWPMTLHYHAPITALMILLLLQAMRVWQTVTWRGHKIGLAISRSVPVSCVVMLTFRLTAAVLHIPVPQYGLVPWFTVTPGNLKRATIEQFLQSEPGTQLALVRYSDTHHTDEEWVHNDADIDASKVVWARDGSAEDNARLFEYYPQRRIWIVEADATPPSVTSLTPICSSLSSH
jgi:hypothetical protein